MVRYTNLYTCFAMYTFSCYLICKIGFDRPPPLVELARHEGLKILCLKRRADSISARGTNGRRPLNYVHRGKGRGADTAKDCPFPPNLGNAFV